MTTPAAKRTEFDRAEAPACQLLERLGWMYVPRAALAAERVIFELEHVNATGMARNQAIHECLTYGTDASPLGVEIKYAQKSGPTRN